MNKEKELNDELDSLLSSDEGVAYKPVVIGDDLKEKQDKIFGVLTDVIEKLSQTEGISKDRLNKEQRPVVELCLNAYIAGRSNWILEAPTGTGKSIINLIITETIRKYNGDVSSAYTLTPTKILQDQLDEDNKRMKLGWALLKGQNNYICDKNGEVFSKRECSKMSISKAQKSLKCALTCEYIIKREEAKFSPNAVLGYAYWLTSMNYIYNFLGDNAPFQPREVTVFDECHLITDIVQDLFKVEISGKIMKYIIHMVQYYEAYEKDHENLEAMISHSSKFKECFDTLFKIAKEHSLNDVFNVLLATTAHLQRITNMFIEFMDKYFPPNELLWSVGEQEFDKNFEKYASIVSGMKYFLANNRDIQNIIIDKFEEDGMVKLTFRTLNESSLVERHVHQFTKFAVWTSATLGGRKGIETWASQNGITDYDYHSMDSTFEFPNSPINICRPTISMAFKDKEKNMSTMMMRIMALCSIHPNERGIIHTGNYEIARNLQMRTENGRDRFIFYNNSKEKEIAIETLKNSSNGIIIGPSLSEGLDLNNDLARFGILAKVPYPNLSDSLIKAKQERIAGWYDWQTVVTIMQQFGRHIRHKTDWGVTYLLDSSFERIILNSTFPPYISDRFTQINVNKVVEQFQDDSDDFADIM